MNDLSCTFNGVTLNQANSFQPQLNVRLDIKYQQRYGNQPQPNYVEIVNAKVKLRVTGKKNPQWIEIGLAEQEFSCSVRPTDVSTMHLICRLSPYIIHKIEELRLGGDLTFQFEPISTGIAIMDQGGISKTDTINFQMQSNQWKYPRSEWIDNLNSIDFNKIELIEIPKIVFPNIPLTEEVTKFLSQANKAFDEGRYGDVLLEGRKIIELLDSAIEEWGKSKTLSDDEKLKFEDIKLKQNGKRVVGKREENLSKLMSDVEKGVRLGWTVGNLQYYFSLNPHEAEHKSTFTIDDAKFVLHSITSHAGNILKYLERKQI